LTILTGSAIVWASTEEDDMTYIPTVKERIDPQSPHYDPEFVKLREAAYQAWNDHQADLKKGNGAFKPGKGRRA
jgi:hypothetical protein